jgi:catechol 2,3-dioxygenase
LTRLGRVRLQVAHLARSRAFYEDILGLRVLDASDGRAVLGPQERGTPLVELIERPGAKPSPLRSRLGLFHVAFLLPERAALGRLIRHLAEHGIEPGRSDHRVSEAVYLRDPDGLGIEVYADRPRTTWTVDANGQIAMSTDPLDVDNLLRAAGDTAWTGAPSGTTVGHVHLHVGDLGRAAAFYHEALGLDKVVWNYPGALFLSAGGYHHHLGMNTWAGDAPPAREDEAQLLEWTLVVPAPDDVEATVQNLESAGHAVSRDEHDLRTTDPWGTALRITAS